jgi:hypothetical protein
MPVPDRARVAALALTGTLAAGALVACSQPAEPRRVGGPQAELADLSGVVSAEVADELVDQDQPGTVVVVDVADDVTVEELTEVFVVIDDIAADAWVVSLACGPASWEETRERDDCDSATGSATTAAGTPEHGARGLLAAARALPDATVEVTGRLAVDVRLAEPGAAAVAEAIDIALADPALQDVGGLTLTAAPGADSERFSVAAADPLSERVAELWRRLGPTLDRLPPRTPGSYSLTLDEDDRIIVTSRVQLPGVVLPEQLTPQRYGATLWPYLRAQLDALDDLGRPGAGPRYTVSNAYRPVADARPHGNDPFLDVTIGAPGRADGLGRTWSLEAARRVVGR